MFLRCANRQRWECEGGCACAPRYDQGHQPFLAGTAAGLYSRCISERRASKARSGISIEHGGEELRSHRRAVALAAFSRDSPTFLLSFALDSINAAPSFLARASPSAVVTRRSPFRSDFWPTMTQGTRSRPPWSRIFSCRETIMSNDCLDVIEYTSM